MAERPQTPWAYVLGLLAISVSAEFLLLRTGTRALIHIPGLAGLEMPIRALAEAGRFAYFLAVVLVVVVLLRFVSRGARSRNARDRTTAFLVVGFLAAAIGARWGVIPGVAVGWVSMAVVAAVTALSVRGARSAPVVVFALSSTAAAWSVLAQGDGGGLSGATVDGLVLISEVLLVLAAFASPWLPGARPTRSSVIVGIVTTLVTAGAFAAGGSTLSIIVLWNVGVPGWLPGITHALALGALATSVWSCLSGRHHTTALGLMLLVAGGVGVISTYQTGLVLAGLLLIAEPRDQITSPVAAEDVAPRSRAPAIAGTAGP